MSRKTCVRVEAGIELWRIAHPADPNEAAFVVKDPRRTPEVWTFSTRTEADAKFSERLLHAK